MIHSLQDLLEDQQQKSVLRINEIQQKYDELKLICRQNKETSESTKQGLEQNIEALQNEQEIKMALIQKLEGHVEGKTDKINSLQFQMRELRMRCKSERCKQRMKNRGTQCDFQQYPLSRIPTTTKVQSMESDIHSEDSEYQTPSDVDVKSLDFDQEILLQSEQESDALSSNAMDYKMLYYRGETLKCVECDRLFEKHPQFIDHMDAEHGIKRPYQCSDCAKCYGTKGNLTQHIKNAHAPRYECGVCHKRFGSKGSLKQHSVFHSAERPFKCSQCTSSFKVKGALTTHIRYVHLNEKRFHCEHCSKGFFYKAAFIEHLRVHTGERPFQCTVCGKTFRTKSQLTIHKRIHIKEKPHECFTCHKPLRHTRNMKTHERKCKNWYQTITYPHTRNSELTPLICTCFRR